MRTQAITVLSMVMVLLLTAKSAFCQPPACAPLSDAQRKLAHELIETQYCYDCCDDTIARCLTRTPLCRLAVRLAENICRRVEAGQTRDEIVRGLSRRARSMSPSIKPAEIDWTAAPMAGDPEAPVVFVEYACGRCLFCAKITPPLYEEIVRGRLQGKARMYFKVFPIRGHEHSTEAGLGFAAAARMGGFWPFMLYAYEYFDRFCEKKQVDWAEAAGLDPAVFEQLLHDPETRDFLVESKKEGLRNKVDATPTFFINMRRYVGTLELSELIDVLEEEYERLTGQDHLP